MTAYAAFIGCALGLCFAPLFGPPWWRAALVAVVGGIGAYLVGVGP